MIVGIKAAQDMGKTSIMVRSCLYLLAYGGYRPEECYGNLFVNVPGFNVMNNAGLSDFMRTMVSKRMRHKVILIDEADGVFPHRFWQDKEQSKALLGLWQDIKLFNWIFWTAHLGNAVDVLLRECTQVTVIPKYRRSVDRTDAVIISSIDYTSRFVVFDHISRIFPYYKRWDPVW